MFHILITIISGFLITLSQCINSELAKSHGPLKGSFINHLVGTLASLLLFLFWGQSIDIDKLINAPFYVFLGGFFGVFFVAILSSLIIKIGVFQTTILVVSSQMIFGTVLDYITVGAESFNFQQQLIGISLIIFGIYIGGKSRFNS